MIYYLFAEIFICFIYMFYFAEISHAYVEAVYTYATEVLWTMSNERLQETRKVSTWIKTYTSAKEFFLPNR